MHQIIHGLRFGKLIPTLSITALAVFLFLGGNNNVKAADPLLLAPACDFVYSTQVVNTNRTHLDDIGKEIDLGANRVAPIANPNLKCTDSIAFAPFDGVIKRIYIKYDTDPDLYNPTIVIVNYQLGVSVAYQHVDFDDPITLPENTQVRMNQVVARISDKGNATFKHIHMTVNRTTNLSNSNILTTRMTYRSTFSQLPNEWEFADLTSVPSITITEPNGVGDVADISYTVNWVDEDYDSNAVIDLYYDTDNSGSNGTPVVDCFGISEDSPTNSCSFNTRFIPNGSYYIYACIDDNDPSNGARDCSKYSPGPLTVNHANLRDAGKVNVNSSEETFVLFNTNFVVPPVVVATVSSENESDMVQAKIVSVTSGGFAIRLEEDDFGGLQDGVHGNEVISWYAVHSSSGNEQVGLTEVRDGNWFSVTYSTAYPTIPKVLVSAQTNNSGLGYYVDLRNVTTTGFQYQLKDLEGLQSLAYEKVGWIAFTDYPGTLEGRVVTGPSRDGNGNPVWEVVNFSTPFSQPPVVLAEINSENDPDPAIVNVRNITTTGFEFRVDEDDVTHDDSHSSEIVGWSAWAQSGKFRLDDASFINGEIIESAMLLNFSRDILPSTLTNQTIQVMGSGGDGSFNEGNEFLLSLPIGRFEKLSDKGIRLLSDGEVYIDLSSVQSLPDDLYRLKLIGGADGSDQLTSFFNARELAIENSPTPIAPVSDIITIYSDLEKIRSLAPEMRPPAITTPPSNPDNVLTATLTPTAFQQYQNGTYHDLDQLNAQYGMVSITSSVPLRRLSIRFNYQYYNLHRLAEIYDQVPSVEIASGPPSSPYGQSGGHYTEVLGNNKYKLGFRWGSCPSGCINNSYRIYQVVNGVAQLVETGGTPYTFTSENKLRGYRTGALDGELISSLPSGNFVPGGDFMTTFTVNSFRVTNVLPTPGSEVTTQPSTIVVDFDKDVSIDSVTPESIEILASGGDGTFNDGNEIVITPIQFDFVSTNQLSIVVDPVQMLNDQYRVTFRSADFLDPVRADLELKYAANLIAITASTQVKPDPVVVEQNYNNIKKIKNAYPDMNLVKGARMGWMPGQLFVNLDPTSFALLQQGKYHAWDSLNETYGPITVSVYSSGPANTMLTFSDPYLNIPVLATQYSALSGVSSAQPNFVYGAAACVGIVTSIERVNTTTYKFYYSQDGGCSTHDWTFTVVNNVVTLTAEGGSPIPAGFGWSTVGVTDNLGLPLDGELQATFPSGNGFASGDFASTFTVFVDPTIVGPEGGSVGNTEGTAVVNVPPELFSEPLSIQIIEETEIPEVGSDFTLAGEAFDLTAINQSGGAVTQFNGDLSVTLAYDPALLEGVIYRSLVLHYFDEVTQVWVPLESEVDSATHSVTALVNHFTLFTVLAESMPLIEVTDLNGTFENLDRWDVIEGYEDNVRITSDQLVVDSDVESGTALSSYWFTVEATKRYTISADMQNENTYKPVIKVLLFDEDYNYLGVAERLDGIIGTNPMQNFTEEFRIPGTMLYKTPKYSQLIVVSPTRKQASVVGHMVIDNVVLERID